MSSSLPRINPVSSESGPFHSQVRFFLKIEELPSLWKDPRWDGCLLGESGPSGRQHGPAQLDLGHGQQRRLLPELQERAVAPERPEGAIAHAGDHAYAQLQNFKAKADEKMLAETSLSGLLTPHYPKEEGALPPRQHHASTPRRTPRQGSLGPSILWYFRVWHFKIAQSKLNS